MTPGRSQNIASPLLVGPHRLITDGGVTNVHEEIIIIELMTSAVAFRRPERARNKESTGPKILNDTLCTA